MEKKPVYTLAVTPVKHECSVEFIKGGRTILRAFDLYDRVSQRNLIGLIQWAKNAGTTLTIHPGRV